MQQLKLENLEKIWLAFPYLKHNEVYMLLLVSNTRKKIIDSMLIKTDNFEEFKLKVNNYMQKKKRILDDTSIYLEVNKKSLRQGLQKAMLILEDMIDRYDSLYNYTIIIQKQIRCSNTTDNRVIEFEDMSEINENDFFLIVKKDDKYYGVTDTDNYTKLFKCTRSLPIEIDKVVKYSKRKIN